MVLNEQLRSTKKRSYEKTKRADDEQRTRARIVDAAEVLHQTVGPARTTVSAIAERAQVTRATVYRHFPDDETLFLACSSQWLSRQRLPDPDSWTMRKDPEARLRAGLADIYRYYRDGEQMLTSIHRDAAAVPPRVIATRIQTQRRWVDTLLNAFPHRSRKTLRAAVGHAAAFDTWRSLCVTQGLSNRSALDLMLGMVTTAAQQTPANRRHRTGA